jgi:hypothetical protein
MRNGSTLYGGLDVHKDSIAVAYASDDGATAPVHVGAVGTRQCDIDALVRKLQSKNAQLVFIARRGPAATGCTATSPARACRASSSRRPSSRASRAIG